MSAMGQNAWHLIIQLLGIVDKDKMYLITSRHPEFMK